VHKVNHSYINFKYKMHTGFNHYCSYRVCKTVIRFWENIPRQIFTHGIDLTCIIAEPNLISKLVIIITKWLIHFKAPWMYVYNFKKLCWSWNFFSFYTLQEYVQFVEKHFLMIGINWSCSKFVKLTYSCM
jgi:hypothetical protein